MHADYTIFPIHLKCSLLLYSFFILAESVRMAPFEVFLNVDINDRQKHFFQVNGFFLMIILMYITATCNDKYYF